MPYGFNNSVAVWSGIGESYQRLATPDDHPLTLHAPTGALADIVVSAVLFCGLRNRMLGFNEVTDGALRTVSSPLDRPANSAELTILALHSLPMSPSVPELSPPSSTSLLLAWHWAHPKRIYWSPVLPTPPFSLFLGLPAFRFSPPSAQSEQYETRSNRRCRWQGSTPSFSSRLSTAHPFPLDLAFPLALLGGLAPIHWPKSIIWRMTIYWMTWNGRRGQGSSREGSYRTPRSWLSEL